MTAAQTRKKKIFFNATLGVAAEAADGVPAMERLARETGAEKELAGRLAKERLLVAFEEESFALRLAGGLVERLLKGRLAERLAERLAVESVLEERLMERLVGKWGEDRLVKSVPLLNVTSWEVEWMPFDH